MVPQIGNYLISNVGDTSVLSVITVGELFYVGRSVAGQFFTYFEVFTVICMIYLVLTTVTTALVRLVEKLAGPKDYVLKKRRRRRHGPVLSAAMIRMRDLKWLKRERSCMKHGKPPYMTLNLVRGGPVLRIEHLSKKFRFAYRIAGH